MYKDPDKQREANRERQRRYKARQKALPKQGVTSEGVTIKLPEHSPNEVAVFERDMLTAKRGKDIKCFEDLPPDVQQTIDSMSIVDGRTDNTIKANRTAIAVQYQHLFPDRYHSTGVAL